MIMVNVSRKCTKRLAVLVHVMIESGTKIQNSIVVRSFCRLLFSLPLNYVVEYICSNFYLPVQRSLRTFW